MPTNEERKLEFIGSLFCKQYQTEASFYIEPPRSAGAVRHLVAQYANSRKEFAAVIPDDWSREDVLELLFWPMKDPAAPYPAWEVPARAFASPRLFAFWKQKS
jgi:hypothetical protein